MSSTGSHTVATWHMAGYQDAGGKVVDVVCEGHQMLSYRAWEIYLVDQLAHFRAHGHCLHRNSGSDEEERVAGRSRPRRTELAESSPSPGRPLSCEKRRISSAQTAQSFEMVIDTANDGRCGRWHWADGRLFCGDHGGAGVISLYHHHDPETGRLAFDTEGFGPVFLRVWRGDDEEQMGDGREEKDFESFCVWMEVEMVTRLFVGPRCPCLVGGRIDGCSESRLQQTGVVEGSGVDRAGAQRVTDPETRGEEIGSRGNRPSRETNQAQIGTRGRGGVHGHGDSDPGHDWSLDLCACPGREDREDREDHAGRWRSTGLSAPDSYGTQPCKRCQPHLADEENVEIEVSAKSGRSDGWLGDAVVGSESRRVEPRPVWSGGWFFRSAKCRKMRM
ncbi:hypothetical protein N7474_000318 [Penicillium riverlandense]|uniref:uncharacterized protein n=1 Tax=Penicillium riverlandense TaxID=1903569 RepID=UPI0025490368|nr:uncharacterized protein N7474_000318 [Penicillium riverlandense]KAJ5832007.1 hypothetical protein N7474_000318 [Penicillium riverlandense]